MLSEGQTLDDFSGYVAFVCDRALKKIGVNSNRGTEVEASVDGGEIYVLIHSPLSMKVIGSKVLSTAVRNEAAPYLAGKPVRFDGRRIAKVGVIATSYLEAVLE